MTRVVFVPRKEAEHTMKVCRRCSPESAVAHYKSNRACVKCTYERAQARQKTHGGTIKALRAEVQALHTKLAAKEDYVLEVISWKDRTLVLIEQYKDRIRELEARLVSNTDAAPAAQPDLIGE